MKKLFAVLALLVALILPSLAQAQQRLSPNDQRRFDSYYSRWQQYRQTNNRSEVVSMERRMQDVYAHYGISANTPYSRVASGGQGGGGGWDRDRDRDRDWDRDRDRDRDRDEDRDHDRDRHHDRGRHRGWYKDHDRHRDHDRDGDHDRDHDRD